MVLEKDVETYSCESGVEATLFNLETLLKCKFVGLVNTLFAHADNQFGMGGNLFSNFQG